MHELSLIQEAIRIAEAHAKAANANCINRIILRVGALTGAVPEALEFAFEVARQGTLAENASLEIETVDPCVSCLDCGHQYNCEGWELICPQCGSFNAKIIKGLELDVKTIEVA